MASDKDFILAPPTVMVSFAVAPVANNLNSLTLVLQAEMLSGFADWVVRTSAALDAERRQKNALVFEVFFGAVEHELDFKDFSDYIDYLAAQDAVVLRDKIVNAYVERLMRLGINTSREELLESEDVFLDSVKQHFSEKYADKGTELTIEIYVDGHKLLHNPPELKALIVEHIQYMWETHLKTEWERNLPILQESIDAFSQLDFSGQTALEAVRTVTGRDLSGYWNELDIAQNLIFIPSAHIGPYVSMHSDTNKLYLFFGARVPEGMKNRSAELSRSELLVRLSALADETRLNILELLTRNDELCAQDIINMLNLSQSSASRHLRQLTATGYLIERRREIAKCYSLNLDRMDDTMNALKYFMRGG